MERVHCLGRAALLPRWNGLTQPPHLHHALQEEQRQSLFLYGERSPGFSPVSLCRNLIGESEWGCLRKRKWRRKRKRKGNFGKGEGVCVWITKGLPLKYLGH